MLIGRLAIWLVLWAVGCSSAPRSTLVSQSAQLLEPRVWQSALDREHPLVGRIWDVDRARFVEPAALRADVLHADLVLIGEQHDNPDHHLLQAELLHALIAAGRRPSLVFEMLDIEQQPVVDRALVAGRDPDALAAAVQWDSSGWPAFSLYRPLFAEVLAAGLPVVAAGIERKAAMRIAREGSAALDASLVQRFGLATPLAPRAQQRLRREMAEAHCGMLPESMLDSMVLVQRARDAQLAERMQVSSSPSGGAVLIAGNGHVRRDQGVPPALEHAYSARALALGMLEVEPGVTDPRGYASAFDSEKLPFAYVWFTPRASDADHCAELRKSMATHRP